MCTNCPARHRSERTHVNVGAQLLRIYLVAPTADLRLDNGRVLVVLAPRRHRFAGLAGRHGVAVIASGDGALGHFMELVDFRPDENGDSPTPSVDYFP